MSTSNVDCDGSIMQVTEVKGKDVVCLIKNSATLAGSLYTLHVSQIRIELPTLTDKDKEVFVFDLYLSFKNT